MEKANKIPPFHQYYPSENQMDLNQKSFFKMWEKNWIQGIPIDVEGNISYLFCYAYKVIDLGYQDAIPQLQQLITAYSNECYFAKLCKVWLSDFYVVLGDYKNALESFPPIELDSRSSVSTDEKLTLKLLLRERISGIDILTLNGPRVTAWGKKHLNSISTYLDIKLQAIEKFDEMNLLENWKNFVDKRPYQVFRATTAFAEANIPCYIFSKNEKVTNFIIDMTHDAENCVREEMSIPKIGEGWIGETELYYLLKKEFPDLDIQHHAHPIWLGKQHLDIFLPSHRIAIEYQGEQHDTPIKYFGGDHSYQTTQKRDIKKKSACTKNKVKLIEVRKGYSFEKIIEEIRAIKNK